MPEVSRSVLSAMRPPMTMVALSGTLTSVSSFWVSMIGIELPLRMLVWREGTEVLLGYRDPRDLSASYEVSEQQATLEQMAALLEQLAAEAASS